MNEIFPRTWELCSERVRSCPYINFVKSDCRRDTSREVLQSFSAVSRDGSLQFESHDNRTGLSVSSQPACIYVYVINPDVAPAKRQSGKRREIIRRCRAALHLARFPSARGKGSFSRLFLPPRRNYHSSAQNSWQDRRGYTMRLVFRNFLPHERKEDAPSGVVWRKRRSARRFDGVGGETKFRNGFLGN